ncbi:MAG: hypothetical protein JWO91_1214, partial [Acidobacteriaceae bacterium]|nr:hypothetical protein [Acidobacteriaceae bacterium]
SADASHSGKIPEYSWSVARAGVLRGMHSRSGPLAPLSRADLIRLQLIQTPA